MMVKIVDTTLRDGEQRAGIALDVSEKVHIAKMLDAVGVYQIEAGIPAMGHEEKESIRKMAELGLKSKLSAWNRMKVEDIGHSLECGADIIHISVPVSDIQISSKLKRDKKWVVDTMKRCICYASGKGYEVTVGLEDASRADNEFLMAVITEAYSEGITRVRYADTVGILHRKRTYEEIAGIRNSTGVEVEFHAHNDLGMAVANSLAAVQAGAEFIDCTIGGVGERAGNCDYKSFINSARGCLGLFPGVSLLDIIETEKEIKDMMRV